MIALKSFVLNIVLDLGRFMAIGYVVKLMSMETADSEYKNSRGFLNKKFKNREFRVTLSPY